jgi:20S proteasome subunit alpha 2
VHCHFAVLSFLTFRYNDDLSLEDAIHTALLTLKEGFEGQMTAETIEIGIVSVPSADQTVAQSGERVAPTFRKLTDEEVRDYLSL